MKLKYLIPMSLSVVALPAITLISCSDSKKELTPTETNEQIFLVNQAAANKYSPKLELKSDINIADINSEILNFKNIPNADKNLSYEILNFEIPLVNATDANVNVKVSSKLNKDIFQTYSFKISSAIIKNGFSILPMNEDAFKKAVQDVYFKNEEFLINLINDISIRISQTSDELDVTLKKIVKDGTLSTLKSIFEIPLEKARFITTLQKYIQSTIINQMNDVALQKGLEINVVDVVKMLDVEGAAKLSINIIFGANSIYSLQEFPIFSFSTKYSNLEKDLVKITNERVLPDLLIGESTAPIPIWDLYNSLSIEIPKNLSMNDSFIIGINTNIPIPTAPNVSEEFEIEVEVFAKNYEERIKGSYKIKIKELVNYEIGKIDFTAIKPVPPVPVLLIKKKEL